MILSYLGSIALGTVGSADYLTGPTADKETFRNSWARHDVIRGKPVVQEIGRDLNERELSFFFDETFCDPPAQWTRLWAAYTAKIPLPFVTQAGFSGSRYVVETLDKENQKTTRRGGIVVRIECSMTLIEAPQVNPLDSLMQTIRSGAGLKSPTRTPDARK